MLVQSRQALTEALIEARREIIHEPKMEGLLMIERNIEGKLSLLLDVVYFGDMAWQRTFGSGW